MDRKTSDNMSVDGFSVEKPTVSAASAERTVMSEGKRASSRFSPVLLAAIACVVVYTLPALVLLALFPRTDGAMQGVKVAGTALYAIGALLWLLLAVVGYLRIASFKDKPRMSFFATIRLLAISVPMLLLSIAVPIWLMIPPKLQLEITSPTTVDEMVAPVPVTFGMTTALRYIASENLTPLKYEWDYDNDGKVDLETFDPTSTYIVSRAGVYNIVARVTMTDGSVKRVLRRLVVSRSSFGVTPAQPIIDEPVTFTLSHLFPKAEGAPTLAKAAWDFDADGSVDFESPSMNATHTFRRLGAAQVSVLLTLGNQTQQTLTRTVQVVEPPKQPFPVSLESEPSTLIGPPPFGIFFTIKTTEPVASVSWDFGDQKVGEGLRVAHEFASVGSYTVTATVRSESGSIAKLTKLVRVTEPLEIRDLGFEGTPPVRNFAVEGPVPLVLNLTPTTIQSLITFTWDAADATEQSVAGKTLSAVYRDEGRYFIDLLGIDADDRVMRKRITVQALPPSTLVEFSIIPAAPVAPALVSFDASDTFVPEGEQITGFEWDFGDSSTKFSGARTEYRYEKAGTYQVTLTVRTLRGNSYVGKKTLVVRAPLLDACFIPSRTSGKAPLGVRFDPSCSTGDFAVYRWNFGDGSESDLREPTHVFETAGTFTVTLTATTATGQSNVTTATITVAP